MVLTPALFLTLLFLFINGDISHAFQLRSSSTISTSKEVLHDYLATLTHWPQIVLSSHSVKSPSFSKNRVDAPLKVGEYVEEVFGLPPILPLSVVWQCVTSDVSTGKLEFYSQDGVPGFANECKMKFDIEEINSGKCKVDLSMEFEPLNSIVPLGIPLLSIDNNLALKILLPRELQRRLYFWSNFFVGNAPPPVLGSICKHRNDVMWRLSHVWVTVHRAQKLAKMHSLRWGRRRRGGRSRKEQPQQTNTTDWLHCFFWSPFYDFWKLPCR